MKSIVELWYHIRVKKIVRFSLLIVFALFNVLAAQNCTQPTHMTAIPVASNAAERGGDGRPYEGKTYVDLSIACSQKGEAYARIAYLSKTHALLVRNNCVDLNQAIDLSASDFSVNTVDDTITYASKVFRAEASQGPQVVRANCDLASLELASKIVQNQIEYSYCLSLGRASDGGGMNSYQNDIASGKDFPWVLMTQVGSGEFDNLYKASSLSDGNYTILMYRLALNRDPSSTELFATIDRLQNASLTRAAFAQEIFSSAEFRALRPFLF